MATGENLKRDGRPSVMQIRYLLELKKLQPASRGFQVVIAEKCHVSTPTINKSLKKAIDQGIITKYYAFTEYGSEWIGTYERLILRLERFLDDINIPASEREKHIRMMIEDMDPFLLETILSTHEQQVKPQARTAGRALEEIVCNLDENTSLKVRIAVYHLDRKAGRTNALSMGNRAFEPTAELIHAEDGKCLVLHIREMKARSRIDGKEMRGRLRSLKYEQDEELKRAEDLTEDSETVRIPLDAFRMHISPGGEMKGALPITVTCSVGNGHMPESTALLVFWM